MEALEFEVQATSRNKKEGDDERRKKNVPLYPQNADCDQLGYMRFNCPVFKRRMEKSDKMNFKEKINKKRKIEIEDKNVLFGWIEIRKKIPQLI